MIKGKHEPIDTETLDGRVNFLVSVLEEYKRQLEQMDEETSEEDIATETQPKKSSGNSGIIEALKRKIKEGE